MVGIADDDRKPYSNGAILKASAFAATHGITVSVRDLEGSEEFMHDGWNGQGRRIDGNFVRYEVGPRRQRHETRRLPS